MGLEEFVDIIMVTVGKGINWYNLGEIAVNWIT